MSHFFSIAHQFVNYYEYHQNTLNKIIHFVFVPVLTFSFIMLLFLVPLDLPVLGDIISPFLRPTLAAWGSLILCTYYLILAIIPGLVLTAEFVSMLVLTEYLHTTMTFSSFIWFAVACQIVGWVTQFVGHGVFEGRRPALTDNIFQVFIAPLFVMLEFLFFLGYDPALKQRIEDMLDERKKPKNK